MQTIELVDILPGCEPVPVLITSTVLKHRREDIRKFPARIVDEGEIRRFILEPSFHELTHDNNFTVGVGCQVNDNSGAYKCIDCYPQQGLRKVHPVLVTKKIPV